MERAVGFLKPCPRMLGAFQGFLSQREDARQSKGAVGRKWSQRGACVSSPSPDRWRESDKLLNVLDACAEGFGKAVDRGNRQRETGAAS